MLHLTSHNNTTHTTGTYGRDPRETTTTPTTKYKVDPKTIRALYADWVMPLTKEVELEYLLQRLSGPRVSFCGKNSPSHEVAAILARRDSTNNGVLVPYDSDKSAVQAVLSNHTSYGIVPLIDAFGVIRQSRTLLCSNENLSVCGVISHRHKFSLVTRRGKAKKNLDQSLWTRVQTIYADSFAIQCCTSWVEIHAPQAQIIRVQDSLSRLVLPRGDDDNEKGITAAFVLSFRDDNDDDDDQKLAVLAQVSGPFTVVRHAVVSKHYGIPSGCDRTLLQFAVRDETGSLNQVLETFSKHRINLQLIESYPVTTKISNSLKKRSMFFVECDGHRDDAMVADALSDLRKSTESLRVIGSYPYEE